MLLNRIKKFALLLGDSGIFYSALFLTLVFRERTFSISTAWTEHFLPFTYLFIFWILVFFINGLYEIAANKNDIEFYNKIVRNQVVNYILGAAYFYFLTDQLFDIKPRGTYFLFLIFVTILWGAWRYWFNSFVQRPKFLKKVLIVGMNDEAKELIQEIIRKPQLGYKISAIIHSNYGQHKFPGVEVLDSSVDLQQVIREKNIGTVITALNPHSNPELIKKLYENLTLKLQFFDLPAFYEKLTGKIPITTIGHIWFLENLQEGDQYLYEFLKRIFDIIFAITVFAISLPFVPFIAAAIKLNSVGPIFFKQTRVGYQGKTFSAIKFRSMILYAEKNGEAVWTQKDDPRITPFGKFLRKTRIDEIPQLINLLKGEMSVVGPRPERPEFVKNLQRDIPFYNERHLVKPGLTGWAQINFQYGASVRDAFKKLQYDLFYIKNRSMLLDVAVLLKTINIILTGRGR